MSFNTGFFIQQASTGDTTLYNMVFDGVNEYVQIPHNEAFNFENTDSFSITAKVKLNSYASNQVIISKRDTVTTFRGYMMYFSAGDLYIYIANSVGAIMQVRTNGVTFTNGVEYHAGFTYDGSMLPSGVLIYVNGVAVSTLALTPGLSAGTMKHTQNMFIAYDILVSFYANGQIGTTRIWNATLTAGEILTDYNSGLILNNPVKSTNLVYGFRGGQNALFGTQWVFPDESGNITNPAAYSINMELADRI